MLRTYAVWDRQRKVLLFFAGLAVVRIYGPFCCLNAFTLTLTDCLLIFLVQILLIPAILLTYDEASSLRCRFFSSFIYYFKFARLNSSSSQRKVRMRYVYSKQYNLHRLLSFSLLRTRYVTLYFFFDIGCADDSLF